MHLAAKKESLSQPSSFDRSKLDRVSLRRQARTSITSKLCLRHTPNASSKALVSPKNRGELSDTFWAKRIERIDASCLIASRYYDTFSMSALGYTVSPINAVDAGTGQTASELSGSNQQLTIPNVTNGQGYDLDVIRTLVESMNEEIGSRAKIQDFVGTGTRAPRPSLYRNETESHSSGSSSSASSDPQNMSAVEMLGVTVENGLKRIRDRAAALKTVDIQVDKDANDLKVVSAIYSGVVQNAKESGTVEGERLALIKPNEIVAVSGGPADTKVISNFDFVEIDGVKLYAAKQVLGGEITAIRHKFPLFTSRGELVVIVTLVEMHLGSGIRWSGAFDSTGYMIAEYYDYQNFSGPSVRASTPEEIAETKKWQKLFELTEKAERGEIRDGMPEWKLFQQLGRQYVVEHTIAKADPNNPFDRLAKTVLGIGVLLGPVAYDALSSVAVAKGTRSSPGIVYQYEPRFVQSNPSYFKIPPRNSLGSIEFSASRSDRNQTSPNRSKLGVDVPEPRVEFPNLSPEKLAVELKLAESLGVKPLRVTDAGFAEVVNAGKVKWAVLRSGELVVIPHSVKASGAVLEISHAVLSGGEPVLAAGEASILARPNNTTVRLLNRHTGHFETSIESLHFGASVFESLGISVLRIDTSIR